MNISGYITQYDDIAAMRLCFLHNFCDDIPDATISSYFVSICKVARLLVYSIAEKQNLPRLA